MMHDGWMYGWMFGYDASAARAGHDAVVFLLLMWSFRYPGLYFTAN